MLSGLGGFPGRLLSRDSGFRLAAVRTWHGLSLDPDSGELRYRDHTQTLTERQADVLAALIDGGPGNLAQRAGMALGSTVSIVLAELRGVLEDLPDFPGKLTRQGSSGRWVLLTHGDSGQPPAGPRPLGGTEVRPGVFYVPAELAEGAGAGRVQLAETPSGYYLPGGPAAVAPAQAVDELRAARWFPRVEGVQVWHLHVDPATGRIWAGDRVLAAEEFYHQVLAPRWRGRGAGHRRLG